MSSTLNSGKTIGFAGHSHNLAVSLSVLDPSDFRNDPHFSPSNILATLNLDTVLNLDWHTHRVELDNCPQRLNYDVNKGSNKRNKEVNIYETKCVSKRKSK